MDVMIIGCGLTGAATAMALKNIGHKVEIFEAATELRPVGAGIALAPNGLRMLHKHIDEKFYQQVLKNGYVLDGMAMINKRNEYIVAKEYNLVNNYGYPILTFQRPILQQLMLKRLEELDIHVNLSKRLKNIKQEKSRVTVTFEDGSEQSCDFLIGCDGINSKTRQIIMGKEELKASGICAVLGISKSIDFESNNKFTNINRNLLHQVRDMKYNFVCIPQVDKKFFWGYIFPVTSMEKNGEWKKFNVEKEIPQLFEAMKTEWKSSFISDIITNTESCVRVELNQRIVPATFHSGRVAILGDAAHAMTPHLGQGVNIGLEDVALLKKYFLKYNKDVKINDLDFENLLSDWEKERIPRSRNVSRAAQFIGFTGYTNNKLLLFIRNLIMKFIMMFFGNFMLKKLFSYDISS